MVLLASDRMDFPFLKMHMPVLLKRFSLSYERDCSCIEYFLHNKEKNQISKNLFVSHEIFSGSLYISKFYPEIYKEFHSKYLSAACFYMMAHHAIKIFHLGDNCCVNLETEVPVFKKFYSRLSQFDFKINYNRPSERVCLKGRYRELPFSTDMITDHSH